MAKVAGGELRAVSRCWGRRGLAVEFSEFGPDEGHVGVSGESEGGDVAGFAGGWGDGLAGGVEVFALPAIDDDVLLWRPEGFADAFEVVDESDVSVDEEDVRAVAMSEGGVGLGGVADFHGELAGFPL